MRSFLRPPDSGRSGRRTEKLKRKYRSRFQDGAARSGRRDLQRFRRTRELIAREMSVFIHVWPVLKSLPPMGTWRWAASSSMQGRSTERLGAPLAKGTPDTSRA